MNPRLAFATSLSLFLMAGCSAIRSSSSDAPVATVPPQQAPPAPDGTVPNAPAPTGTSAPVMIPAPPKPSLARLTDKNRPKLEFFGATIYADAISGTEARGNVFVDGTDLHRVQRAFPIAVYADEVRIDPLKGEATVSGWPIVQTDSAYVQGQAAETFIQLSQNQVASINGPAKYVVGDQAASLFLP